MEDKPPGIRRLCVAYGVESPDGCGSDEKIAAERRGIQAFTGVCASLGLSRMLLDRHSAGQVGVLPVGIDEPRVVSSLVEGLIRATAGLNVRLRLAFHEGVTTFAADGFRGNAIATVRRLAESPPLRAALAEHPGADLAVMLSPPVFEGIGPGLPADQFRQVEIAGPGASPWDVAWIFVPHRHGRRARRADMHTSCVDITAKLQIKPGQRISTVAGSDDVPAIVAEGTPTAGSPDTADVIVAFVRIRADLDTLAGPAIDAARRDKLTWIAYPKAGKLGTDLNRDTLRELLVGHGIQPVRQVAIDDVWSALRFRPA